MTVNSHSESFDKTKSDTVCQIKSGLSHLITLAPVSAAPLVRMLLELNVDATPTDGQKGIAKLQWTRNYKHTEVDQILSEY